MNAARTHWDPCSQTTSGPHYVSSVNANQGLLKDHLLSLCLTGSTSNILEKLVWNVPSNGFTPTCFDFCSHCFGYAFWLPESK